MKINCYLCGKEVSRFRRNGKMSDKSFCSKKCLHEFICIDNVNKSIGKTYGYLKVKNLAYIKNNKSYVICECECGKEFDLPLVGIKKSLSTACVRCESKFKFLKNVNIIDKNTWIWTGYKNKKGYGITKNKLSKSILAHRVSYELFIGRIAKGLCVCHKDDNPSNVCPSNLFLATIAGNVKDMVLKDRQCKGTNKYSCKLKEDDVREIRRLFRRKDVKINTLAKLYNVHVSTISDVIHRKTWKHV